MSKQSHQSQSEYTAGYQHGLQGGSEPKPDKGRAYYGGWLAGHNEFSMQHKQGEVNVRPSN